MRATSVAQRAMALSLVFILVSCRATRHSVAGPTSPQDLADYALIIKTQLDGETTHEWVPLSALDLAAFKPASYSGLTNGLIVRTASTSDECWQEYQVCVPTCQASTRTLQIGNMIYNSQTRGRWSSGKWDYCREACLEVYARCVHDVKVQAVRFEAIQPAVDWVKDNSKKILVGTVVVIAGIAFVAVVLGSGGSGLALLPLVGGAAAAMASACEPESSTVLAVKP